MDRARRAGPAEFPALFDEFDNTFPKDTNYEVRLAAHKWLLGLWIARDADAAAAWVAEKGGDYLENCFGQVLAASAPEKAAALLNGPHGQAMGKHFTAAVTLTLATAHPREYLRAVEKPGKSASRFWPDALGALAVENPREAAALWTERQTANGAEKALSAVLRAWVQRDPEAARAWADKIGDPKLQRLARHAWLTSLARQDLTAARRALADFEGGEWISGKPPGGGATSEFLISDARMEVARLTARTDLAAALKDLAAIAKAPQPPDRGTIGIHRAIDTRAAIVEAALPALPNEPAALLAALQNLKSATGPAMEAGMFADVEAEVLSRKFGNCSTDTALEAIRLLGAREGGGLKPALMTDLMIKAIRGDAARAVDILGGLPEAQRGDLARTAFDNFRQHDPALLARLATFIPADEWGSHQAVTLSRAPAENAALVAGLPVNEHTGTAREDFGAQWAVNDPDAAAQWIGTLPQNAGSTQAARGVANAWAGYDDVAASSWVASLPAGPARDGAALGLAAGIAATDPEAAWKWAASMGNPDLTVVAYANVGRAWGADMPGEFKAAWMAALDAAGLHGEDRLRAMNELEQLPGKPSSAK